MSSPLRAPGIAKARQNSRQALATKKVIRECAFFFPSFFLAGQLAEGWLEADQSCVPAYTQRTDDGARAVFLLFPLFHRGGTTAYSLKGGGNGEAQLRA